MLGSLFRRAQATVDNAIEHLVSRALVAIPFLIAAGFGTLKDKVWRIGLMGYSSRKENVTLLLGALRELLKE